MATRGEQFEIDSTNYLNKQYGTQANFVKEGGANSTKADICVTTKSNKTFYIEVKHCPAQCGQFVALPDIPTQTIVFSGKNATKQNDYTNRIIAHMNTDFEGYKEGGTTGKEIIFDNCSEVFSSWIIDYYKSKNVEYFITNDYLILPINRFSAYFKVTAKYRTKRSGSGNVGKAKLSIVLSHIESLFDINAYKNVGTKLFVTAQAGMHDTRFIFNGYEYMFSLRGDEYEIRKLSNTFNANVIFSISLKLNQKVEDLALFEKALEL